MSTNTLPGPAFDPNDDRDEAAARRKRNADQADCIAVVAAAVLPPPIGLCAMLAYMAGRICTAANRR